MPDTPQSGDELTRLAPPSPVLEIASRLEQAGFETWCVGGAVRDALLGHPHLDWDLATAALPEQVREIFGRRLTIPVGIEFGTVGVLDAAGTMHEVTTFRRDIRTDGRHAVVEFGAALDDDLARRDFTINAIAYSPRRREIRDPFGGRADLRRGIVRAVGDAEARMREDRLRALRAIRFSARFGFAIEPATHRAIEESAPHLGRLSAERVKQELEKTMDQIACPSAALAIWQSTGALRALVPALAGVTPATIASLDRVAMPSLASRPARRLVRFAVLFSELSESEARRALTALRFSTRDAARIAALVGAWRDLAGIVDAQLAAARELAGSDRDVRAIVARVGRLEVAPFARMAAALSASVRDDARARRAFHALYRRMLVVASRDPLTVADLAVDGEDLVRAGVPAGPMVGKILRTLLALVLDDPARNRTALLLTEVPRLLRSAE